MNEDNQKLPGAITATMIAPCGMNCTLCIGHLRQRKPCPGCHGEDAQKPGHCVTCRIVHCEELAKTDSAFCYACNSFPCPRLKRLDKRYRTKYGMSMLENLRQIEQAGLEAFLANERVRWACPECGNLICVHREECMACGRARG